MYQTLKNIGGSMASAFGSAVFAAMLIGGTKTVSENAYMIVFGGCLLASVCIILAVTAGAANHTRCTPIKHLTQRQGLVLGAAVADDVAGVPFKRHARTRPPQPNIEHVVQKQVGQEWADDPSLRRSQIPLHKSAASIIIGAFNQRSM